MLLLICDLIEYNFCKKNIDKKDEKIVNRDGII